MQQLEETTHSFVIRLWLEEEMGDISKFPNWRGHVTHVPSHNRVYVNNYNSIIQFIRSYMENNQIQHLYSDE